VWELLRIHKHSSADVLETGRDDIKWRSNKPTKASSNCHSNPTCCLQITAVIDVMYIELTTVTQQKLPAILGGASRYDSDFEQVGVREVDGLFVAVGGRWASDSRCLRTAHRHAVTARHSLFDHCVDLPTYQATQQHNSDNTRRLCHKSQ